MSSIEQKYLYELNNNDVDEQEARSIQPIPMDNIEIMNLHIPNSKFLLYSELSQYNSIEELFSSVKSIILLYQPLQGNMGHFVCISLINNTFEYFCSYGGLDSIDRPIRDWYKDGQVCFLSNLLEKASKNLRIIYNKFQFQKKSASISTCGRYATFRAMTINNSLSLPNFIDLMIYLKQKTNRPFDNIISDLINVVN